MKKSYLFPNFVLPLFGALAVMCAGSCSQEILESEEVIPDGQTRASTFEISLTVDPAVAGPGNEYYAKYKIEFLPVELQGFKKKKITMGNDIETSEPLWFALFFHCLK